MVSGRTAPGPAGLLRSPACDSVRVWFRTDALRAALEGSGSIHEVAADSRALFRHTAHGLIGVADNTGRAFVDLSHAQHLGDDLVTRRNESTALSRHHPPGDTSALQRLDRAGLLPARAYGHPLELREESIGPDQRITALGRPRRQSDGSLLLARGLAISGDDPDQWISRAHRDVAGSGSLVGILPTGVAVSVLGAALIAMGTKLT